MNIRIPLSIDYKAISMLTIKGVKSLLLDRNGVWVGIVSDGFLNVFARLSVHGQPDRDSQTIAKVYWFSYLKQPFQ